MDLSRLHAAYEDGSIERVHYCATLTRIAGNARRSGNDLLVAEVHRWLDEVIEDAAAEALVG